jgi:hypothetical protein
MFALKIIFSLVWVFAFFLLAPNWLMLMSFIPLGFWLLGDINPAYVPWIYPMFLPIIVFDIETLQGDIRFNGIWNYVSWLPSVFLLALAGYLFNWHGFHFSLGTVWDFIISVGVIILVSKLWISSPLMLFINRLSIIEVTESTYHLKELKSKQVGRSVSYYLESNNQEKLEIPGIVFTYLRLKKVNPNDEVIFKFKQGWLGTTFSRGFPRVGKRATQPY